ncbi:MAG: cytochrome P450, partial [Actinobacteria bacterium]|nr:cytochrome P450 [Actinomycetota bacterium]
MSEATAPLIDDDLLGEAALADPHSALAVVREHDPVHWNPVLRAWLITRHEDVTAGFRDQERLSSDRITPVFEQKLSPEERTTRAPTFEILQHWLVFRDPPDHTRLRALMRMAFTPRAVELLRPRVDEIVGELIDSALERGEIDMVRDFAYPIPAIVIAEMLGAPPEDRDRFKSWSDDITVLVFGGENTPERKAQAQHGLTELADYLRHLIKRFRSEPGDNLLSALVAAQDHDDRLTDDEILSNATLLLF